MIWARVGKHFVNRGDGEALLNDFLKSRFGIEVGLRVHYLRQFSENKTSDKFIGRFHSLIKIDRANQRFHSIGQNYLPGSAGILGLAAGQQDVFLDTKAAGNFRQDAVVNQ